MEIVIAIGIGAWILFSGVVYRAYIKREIQNLEKDEK